MKIYYWSPFFTNIATIKAVIKSAESLVKFSKEKKYDVSLIDAIGEWDPYDKIINKKINNLNMFRLKFNNKVKNLLFSLKKEGKKIYGMGAAPRACVMLNSCNLTKNEISLIGEVAQSLKCNKYVPGTNIMVRNENKIISDKPDYVIILAWHLQERIINLLLKKGYKGDFIIPLPNLKIIKNKNSL